MVKIGSLAGMRLELLAGKAAAISWRNDVGERFAGTDRVGQQRAAAFQVFAEPRAFGIGQVEILPAVHEDHVVLKQARVADVDQIGRGTDLQFQFALRCGAEQVQKCAGRIVAAAAVAEFGDFDDAAAGPVAEADSPSGVCRSLFFAFRLAVRGVGENVNADGERIGDVLSDVGRVVSPLAGAGQFPIARQISVAVDDTGAATVFDAVQVGRRKENRDGRCLASAKSDGRAGSVAVCIQVQERRRAISWRNATSKRPESLQQASAKMKPPRST